MGKRLWIIGMTILLVGICVVSGWQYQKYVNAHNLKIEKSIIPYQNLANSEREWLRDCQISSGAILTYGKDQTAKQVNVNPYFANIAVDGLLSGTPDQSDLDVAKKYIEWYFRHLNKAEDDPVNGAGTIFDYNILYKNNGLVEEVSKQTYDSADAYAGTFLKIVARYMELTNDEEWIVSWRSGLFLVSDSLLNCVGKKKVFANQWKDEIYYSMDNCEAFAGIRSISPWLNRLAKTESQKDTAKNVAHYKEESITLFHQAFWSKETQSYEIGFDRTKNYISFTDPERIYPELVCLIFPQVWGMNQSQKIGQKMYQTVCERREWETLSYYGNESDSIWPVFAYAGAWNHDKRSVDQYLKEYETIIESGRGYPLHVDDSGWVIQTCEKMIEHLNASIIRVPWAS